MRRRAFGFTIIELLVVMAILGILAAAMMPLSEMLVTSQKERELKQALWEIRSAIDDYKKVTSRAAGTFAGSSTGYPPKLQTLVDGIPDPKPESGGKQLYFLRAIPRDPFADARIPAENTWRLRSYSSPADKPTPGADVYDIHSSSDAVAIDGTFYAKW